MIYKAVLVAVGGYESKKSEIFENNTWSNITEPPIDGHIEGYPKAYVAYAARCFS